MKYSPRKTPNVGLTDGERVERLWSFMCQFAKITKEMSADERHDVLTDAAICTMVNCFVPFGKFYNNYYMAYVSVLIFLWGKG